MCAAQGLSVADLPATRAELSVRALLLAVHRAGDCPLRRVERRHDGAAQVTALPSLGRWGRIRPGSLGLREEIASVDRQVLLAIALSALVVIAYQQFLRIYYPDYAQNPRPGLTETPPALTPQAAPAQAPPAQAAPGELQPTGEEVAPAPSEDIHVETPLVHAGFSSVGGRLVSLKLKRYRAAIDPQSPPLDLVAPSATNDMPLGAVLRGSTSWTDRQLVYSPSASTVTLGQGQSGEIVL